MDGRRTVALPGETKRTGGSLQALQTNTTDTQWELYFDIYHNILQHLRVGKKTMERTPAMCLGMLTPKTKSQPQYIFRGVALKNRLGQTLTSSVYLCMRKKITR